MIWLAFDIGTTRTKAALLDDEQNVLASSMASYESTRDPNQEVEQNSLDWWHAVLETSKNLSNDSDFSKVEAIVLTGQMQNLTLLDENDEPLRQTILYSDTRAQLETQNLEAFRNTLQQHTQNELDASSLIAKSLWLKNHEPDVYRQAHKIFLGAADVIAYLMTGVQASDTTTASTTGLFDLAKQDYLPPELFIKLGLESFYPKLPRLVSGGKQAGYLKTDVAQLLNLKANIPVYLAPGDAGSATLGAGCGEIGQAYGYIGTSGWVAFSSTKPSKQSGVFNLAHPQVNHFIQVAPLLTAGGVLDWVRDLFSEPDYDTLIQQAFNKDPQSLLFLPYLNGERCPVRDPLARGAFIGLSSKTDKADMYRAVLEGIIFNYRQALQTLMPSFPETLMFTGGGTKSAAWCQLFANILRIPVQVIKEAEFAGLRGAQLSALVALGKRKNYALQNECVTFEPDAALEPHYTKLYDAYLDIYPSLKETFIKLGQTKI